MWDALLDIIVKLAATLIGGWFADQQNAKTLQNLGWSDSVVQANTDEQARVEAAIAARAASHASGLPNDADPNAGTK